ncbi:hypothetical protein C0991_007216 [Blastosporella zonata]|nr:hypothetical protein C0991_007216 [Blastosporella zonata]
MTPQEETLLRDIGVLLLGNLAGFTAMTLVYGVFILLFSICSYKIANRGTKTLATAVVFYTGVIAFLITTVYWCAYLASFATLVRGILVDTDVGPLDTNGSFEGINAKNLRFVRMQSWTGQLLPMISDAVLLKKGNIAATVNMSQARVLAIAIIESGTMYASAKVINLAFELLKPTTDSTLYFAAIVITSIYAVCAAMFPTVVILLWVIQRSSLHLLQEIPIIAKPTNAAAKGTGARQATLNHLSFAAGPGGTQRHTTTSVQSPHIVSFTPSGQPEKARTLVDSSEHLDDKLEEKQTKTAPF